MATIKDVARQAGVSVATVSRVLNSAGYVHEDTRKKVEDAILALNYSPNEVARSLYKRKSKLIGLLIPDITNPYFPQIARGVEDEMRENDYRIIIGNSDENEQKELEYLQTFTQNNVVGVITLTNNPDTNTYASFSLPVVFLDRTSHDKPSVYADGWQGGRLAAEAIIAGGSREVTVMQGPAHVKPAQDRYQGALDALKEAGMDYHVIQTSSFSFHNVDRLATNLFDTYPSTDGIIASNDLAAIAVIHEAVRRGRRVPEDVQIVGFDDIPISGLLSPALSTIRQPAYEMGRAAARLLINLIDNKHNMEAYIQFPVEYIERNTTRKVARNK
ncbi:LacI family DNA-binding transcriptional regulator [Paenibacillus shunpengii]|uniref:LacI family DNA-binding transcriptional regulator n=1 Tax=Paenibacillus shunpengii TaxID=2054424 RepID=A0ABW5SP60_9BACL|nr:LacI family DNA-binding transcriptional regulator [Paenibacillus sp. FSL H7-0326]OMC67277.1 LacI family transcriptional regulator [Paenibacillus sp. FSL H7-0326]